MSMRRLPRPLALGLFGRDGGWLGGLIWLAMIRTRHSAQVSDAPPQSPLSSPP